MTELETSSFGDFVSTQPTYIEEGTVLSRNFTNLDLPETSDITAINGTPKGNWVWNGTYTVQLDRGFVIKEAYCVAVSGRGACEGRAIPRNERVTIYWYNVRGIPTPVIADGATLNFFTKQYFGQGHLLDYGERIIRSGICKEPEKTSVSNMPFADNQFEQPTTAITAGKADENPDKIIKNLGGEVFFDKFGRVLQVSRHPDHELLITNGKIDSGQDDISDKTTITAQDTYYDAIENDESEVINKSEPFAPRPINLKQYVLNVKTFKIKDDQDQNRRIPYGVLPRFDKWKFKPIVIRKYAAESDGTPEGTTHSVHQVRGNTKGSNYGYVETVSNFGDIKEFISRHKNQRIVGDFLQSIGGNYELKLKATDRKADGSSNPENKIHQEFLKDGTVRLRSNEDVDSNKANFDQTIKADGSLELYIKKGGGDSSDYKLKIKYDASTGDVTVDTKGKISMTSTGDTEITVTGDCKIESTGKTDIKATGNCNVDGAMVNLGKNLASQLCNNFPVCVITGAPHALGNTNVMV